MNPHIDYTKIRTESDIKLAKEKLKYKVLLQEEMLGNSLTILRNNFFISLKNSAWRIGRRMAASAVLRMLQRKRK